MLDSVRAAINAQQCARPKDAWELWLWVERQLGFEIAWRPVCEGHVAPFQFLADAFFRRFAGAVLLGARGSGKTRARSILHQATGHLDPGSEMAHVGAVLRQAQLCHGYVREYMSDPRFRTALLRDPVMAETRWKNGSRLQILPGSLTATSGPHPQRAVFDEFDLAPWEVFQQFIGMAMSSEEYEAQVIYTSAMVTSFGPMSRLLAEAPQRGLKIYRSCILDVLAPCDGDRGGSGPTCVDALNLAKGIKLSPPACPLWEDCQGRARYATGHVRLQDVLAKRLQLDDDTWNVQMLCRKTSRTGLVYERFEPEPAPLGKTNVSEEADYKSELPVVFLCDDGYAVDPLVILAANELKNGDLHVFDELMVTQELYETALGHVVQKGWDQYGQQELRWQWREVEWDEVRGPRETGAVRLYKKPSAAYCGATDKQLQAHLRALGLPVRSPSRTGVVEGLGLVRRAVCNANNHRGLVFHARCRNSIAMFGQYHRKRLKTGEYTEQPAENSGRSNPDDAPDVVRNYFACREESRQQRLAPAGRRPR